MHRRRHPLAGLLFALCVASCGEEDRVYTVYCPPTNGALSVDLGSGDARSLGVGELNSKHLSVGSILRVTPSPSPIETGTAREVYTLRISSLDLSPPRTVNGGRLVANPRIEVNIDVRRAAAGLGIDLEQLITSGTHLYIHRGTLKSLRDVAAITSADPGAVDLIRTDSKGTRFLVVSAAVYGSGALLLTSIEPLKGVAANTVKLGDFYLHANFVCPAVYGHSSPGRSRWDDPVVVFYTPVAYDESTARIVVDASGLDLTKLELDNGR